MRLLHVRLPVGTPLAPVHASGEVGAPPRRRREGEGMSEAARPEPPTFVIGPGPHVHSPETTSKIMWAVNAALAPAAIWGVIVFGMPALAVVAASIAGALASEWATNRLLKGRASV